jgi:hypothetical protein
MSGATSLIIVIARDPNEQSEHRLEPDATSQ